MNIHIGQGIDELDQLNDILYDLYVDDQAEGHTHIKDADSQAVLICRHSSKAHGSLIH